MRIRYADSREERSAVVKLTHVLLVRQMACEGSTLSWNVCRHLLCSLDKAQITAQANQAMASDTLHQETPAKFLGGLGKPKRKFDISSLAKHMTAQRGNLVHDASTSPMVASSSSQVAVPNLPFADPASSRRWVMIKHKGAPHVHLLQTSSDLPLCRRRQGRLGKPFRRLQSAGDGIASLTQMGWSGPETLCKVCFAALPDSERGALMRP